jgi:hypothetical protein
VVFGDVCSFGRHAAMRASHVAVLAYSCGTDGKHSWYGERGYGEVPSTVLVQLAPDAEWVRAGPLGLHMCTMCEEMRQLRRGVNSRKMFNSGE